MERERLAVVGSGAIACGLAAVALEGGDVTLLARSDTSAETAARHVRALCERADGPVRGELSATCDLVALAGATFVVEAIVEDAEAKAAMFGRLDGVLDADTILATTTSSLSIATLAADAGRPDRFVGLHVFNPVTRMELVELAFPDGASERTRSRARDLCQQLGKTPVEVPDVPGFVVNRLLFPYLFEAVRLMDATQLDADSIDTCMRLGTRQPLGPLALLDLVGLDVSAAIGRAIGSPVPERIDQMVADGALGRKTKQGFYAYDG